MGAALLTLRGSNSALLSCQHLRVFSQQLHQLDVTDLRAVLPSLCSTPDCHVRPVIQALSLRPKPPGEEKEEAQLLRLKPWTADVRLAF